MATEEILRARIAVLRRALDKLADRVESEVAAGGVAVTHIYKGWTIAPNGDEWSYRKSRWEMWSHAFTLAEAKAAIDWLEVQ